MTRQTCVRARCRPGNLPPGPLRAGREPKFHTELARDPRVRPMFAADDAGIDQISPLTEQVCAMDEPGPEDPQQPGTGLPADPAPPQAVDPPPAHRLRGALVSRAAGWVVAVALAGAVVALSAVLAAAPRGLQAQAPDGAMPPGLMPAAVCSIHARPGSVRVVLPPARAR